MIVRSKRGAKTSMLHLSKLLKAVQIVQQRPRWEESLKLMQGFRTKKLVAAVAIKDFSMTFVLQSAARCCPSLCRIGHGVSSVSVIEFKTDTQLLPQFCKVFEKVVEDTKQDV